MSKFSLLQIVFPNPRELIIQECNECRCCTPLSGCSILWIVFPSSNGWASEKPSEKKSYPPISVIFYVCDYYYKPSCFGFCIIRILRVVVHCHKQIFLQKAVARLVDWANTKSDWYVTIQGTGKIFTILWLGSSLSVRGVPCLRNFLAIFRCSNKSIYACMYKSIGVSKKISLLVKYFNNSGKGKQSIPPHWFLNLTLSSFLFSYDWSLYSPLLHLLLFPHEA